MITRRIASSKKISSSSISAFLAAFGQFVDHDLAETPIFKGESGGQLNCCKGFPLEKVNIKWFYFTKDLQSCLDGLICFDFSQQPKTDQISVQLPDDCPSGMKQVVAQI